MKKENSLTNFHISLFSFAASSNLQSAKLSATEKGIVDNSMLFHLSRHKNLNGIGFYIECTSTILSVGKIRQKMLGVKI